MPKLKGIDIIREKAYKINNSKKVHTDKELIKIFFYMDVKGMSISQTALTMELDAETVMKVYYGVERPHLRARFKKYVKKLNETLL